MAPLARYPVRSFPDFTVDADSATAASSHDNAEGHTISPTCSRVALCQGKTVGVVADLDRSFDETFYISFEWFTDQAG